MKINDIFSKDINRNIRGVIKIGQDDEPIKKQELEEYVVTNELRENFTNFFEAYSKGIGQVTDEIGVWISGFFGSGKSHFLKILSYLLQNDEIAGKRAIDYFRDDHKFGDNHTLALMEQAEKVPTDVVLFNIDAKADANAAKDSGAILTVFLKVFNEHLGYSAEPVLAEMERWLDDQEKYIAFKDQIKQITGQSWCDIRNTYAFMTDTIGQALVASDAMTPENAQGYVQKLQSGMYEINAINFAKMVKAYLDKKGHDQHIVFLVDEVGQFIGDDGNRMLNLQGIVEQLGVECQGKAWVVVTSQQQMDEVTTKFDKQDRDDFSKIQGRFNTMITMSSANADEVIQKRLLEKTPRAVEMLTDIFAQNDHNINNKLDFSDRIQRTKFNDATSFVTNYPFIPYQFKLLKDVLRAVRKHGAEGKHMSDGERSMLATFQEATKHYENDEVGRLVPFNAFFQGMQEFLSHDHQVVFAHAKSDQVLSPDSTQENLNLQVLEVLFMVKYLDDFPATITNITTLLLDDINTDRRQLTEQVEKALKKLERQNYILKNIDTYEFLTDKEQEVNQTINSYDIDDNALVTEIGDYLIGGKLLSTRYSYPRLNNRYIFNFNAYIDGKAFGRTPNELSIRIVTPLEVHDESEFIGRAQLGRDIVVVLPDNDNYIDNYRRAAKIKQYLQKPTTGDARESIIRLSKGEERNAQLNAAKQQLQDALKEATIYVVDSKLDGGTDITKRLSEAFQTIVNENYRRLDYIESGEDEKDILALLKGSTDLELDQNKRAVTAVLDYINEKTGQGASQISMSELREIFAKIPYAYNEIDVAWLVVRAFVDGKLRLAFNGELITLDGAKKDSRTVYGYLTNRHQVEKLTLQTVREVPKREMADARTFVRDVLDTKKLLSYEVSSEQFAMNIVAETQKEIALIKTYLAQDLPGDALLSDGLKLLKKIVQVNDSYRIYHEISEQLDSVLDWNEDMEDKGIWEFYKSETQQEIWQRSKEYVRRYNEAAGYITAGSDNNVITVTAKMQQLQDQPNLGQVIPQLNELNEQFIVGYNDLITQVYQEYQAISRKQGDILRQRLQDVQFPTMDDKQYAEKIARQIKRHDENAAKFSDSGEYIRLVSEQTLLQKDLQELQTDIDDHSRELAAKVSDSKIAETNNANRDNEHNDDDQDYVTAKASVKSETKTSKTVRIGSLESMPWRITSKAELEQKLQALQEQLEHELQNTDILNVDFK